MPGFNRTLSTGTLNEMLGSLDATPAVLTTNTSLSDSNDPYTVSVPRICFLVATSITRFQAIDCLAITQIASSKASQLAIRTRPCHSPQYQSRIYRHTACSTSHADTIRRLYEDDSHSVVEIRTDSLQSLRELGPPDLVHLVKQPVKSTSKQVGHMIGQRQQMSRGVCAEKE
jgi:hypothetical protein